MKWASGRPQSSEDPGSGGPSGGASVVLSLATSISRHTSRSHVTFFTSGWMAAPDQDTVNSAPPSQLQRENWRSVPFTHHCSRNTEAGCSVSLLSNKFIKLKLLSDIETHTHTHAPSQPVPSPGYWICPRLQLSSHRPSRQLKNTSPSFATVLISLSCRFQMFQASIKMD